MSIYIIYYDNNETLNTKVKALSSSFWFLASPVSFLLQFLLSRIQSLIDSANNGSPGIMLNRRRSTGTFVSSMPLRRRGKQNGYSACAQLAFVALGCCVSFTSIVVLFLLLHVPHKGSFHKATDASPSTVADFSSKIRGTRTSRKSLASPQINHVYSKALIPHPKYTKNRQGKVALLVHISRALDGRDQTRMVQNLFDSLYMTLECDLHHHNFVILLGFDEIAF